MVAATNFLTSLLLATVAPHQQDLTQEPDVSFHSWCRSVGIETPLVKLITTSKSVASRGVFASEKITEGDVVIRIPEHMALHSFNAGRRFPEEAKRIERLKRQYKRTPVGFFSRILRGGEKTLSGFSDVSDFWQAELALYSLAALREVDGNNEWASWISQWRRSDPMQTLYDNCVTLKDREAVEECVQSLHQMLPDVKPYKIRAAIELRLRRLEDMKQVFGLDDDAIRMYGILGSRAIELGGEATGVLPMFDMVNHSMHPNLALSFDGECFELWATRQIGKGEELFLSYHSDEVNHTFDEDDAVWTLVQWGIPQRVHTPDVEWVTATS